MLPFTLNNLNYYINVTIIILPPTRKGSNYSVQAVNILCKEPGLLPTSYTNPKFRNTNREKQSVSSGGGRSGN
ncbi:MAG: hypothetical protein UX64_C0015G0008 [Microgenomates group bacterium GW2011_GWC2_46_7]|nr:MAG: hypothetical protein UX64_C0015G0008 [Microgenomates group bacterium GW2011_GWC2_46_7]